MNRIIYFIFAIMSVHSQADFFDPLKINENSKPFVFDWTRNAKPTSCEVCFYQENYLCTQAKTREDCKKADTFKVGGKTYSDCTWDEKLGCQSDHKLGCYYHCKNSQNSNWGKRDYCVVADRRDRLKGLQFLRDKGCPKKCEMYEFKDGSHHCREGGTHISHYGHSRTRYFHPDVKQCVLNQEKCSLDSVECSPAKDLNLMRDLMVDLLNNSNKIEMKLLASTCTMWSSKTREHQTLSGVMDGRWHNSRTMFGISQEKKECRIQFPACKRKSYCGPLDRTEYRYCIDKNGDLACSQCKAGRKSTKYIRWEVLDSLNQCIKQSGVFFTKPNKIQKGFIFWPDEYVCKNDLCLCGNKDNKKALEYSYFREDYGLVDQPNRRVLTVSSNLVEAERYSSARRACKKVCARNQGGRERRRWSSVAFQPKRTSCQKISGKYPTGRMLTKREASVLQKQRDKAKKYSGLMQNLYKLEDYHFSQDRDEYLKNLNNIVDAFRATESENSSEFYTDILLQRKGRHTFFLEDLIFTHSPYFDRKKRQVLPIDEPNIDGLIRPLILLIAYKSGETLKSRSLRVFWRMIKKTITIDEGSLYLVLMAQNTGALLPKKSPGDWTVEEKLHVVIQWLIASSEYMEKKYSLDTSRETANLVYDVIKLTKGIDQEKQFKEVQQLIAALYLGGRIGKKMPLDFSPKHPVARILVDDLKFNVPIEIVKTDFLKETLIEATQKVFTDLSGPFDKKWGHSIQWARVISDIQNSIEQNNILNLGLKNETAIYIASIVSKLGKLGIQHEIEAIEDHRMQCEEALMNHKTGTKIGRTISVEGVKRLVPYSVLAKLYRLAMTLNKAYALDQKTADTIAEFKKRYIDYITKLQKYPYLHEDRFNQYFLFQGKYY